jgi:hypothetical protein
MTIMAYVSQEKKAKIAAALKLVVPKGWKYSLGVENHRTICMTISAAPVDLIADYNAAGQSDFYRMARGFEPAKDHISVNEFHFKDHFGPEVRSVLEKIVECLNIDNFDKSDAQTDYFCVGHYVSLNIGRWNKPFVCTAPVRADVDRGIQRAERNFGC